MRKLLKLSALLISSVYLTGCAPALQRQGYTLNPKEQQTSDCNIVVTSDLTVKGKTLGTLKVYDNGFSTNCSESEVIKILKNEGCQIGADAVVLTEIKQPDLISTCYRVTGVFVKLDSTGAENTDIAAKESREYSPQAVADREKTGNGMQVLGYLLGFVIGFSITFFLFSHK